MPFPIDPNAMYTELELRQAGAFSEYELKKARAQGLRFKDLGRGSRCYLGRWLLQWLDPEWKEPAPPTPQVLPMDQGEPDDDNHHDTTHDVKPTLAGIERLRRRLDAHHEEDE